MDILLMIKSILSYFWGLGEPNLPKRTLVLFLFLTTPVFVPIQFLVGSLAK